MSRRHLAHFFYSSEPFHPRQRSGDRDFNQNQSVAVLHLGFLGVHLIRAGVGSLPDLVMAAEAVLVVHLQTFPLLLLFRLRLAKLGFYLDWVYVGVEVAHDGKDDADHHQQRGKQDVLSPLVKKTHTQFD